MVNKVKPELFLQTLEATRLLLGLEKEKAPFDVIEFLNATSPTFSNPVVQVFQTGVKVLDAQGEALVISWPDSDTTAHVKLALDNDFWPVVHVYLEARLMGISGTDALTAALLDRTYTTVKPKGFSGVAGIAIEPKTIKPVVAGFLAGWKAQKGEIEMSKKSKKRSSRLKVHDYEKGVDSLLARVARLQAQE